VNNYLIINLVFTGVIIVLLIYSFLFRAGERKHPLPSGSEWVTGIRIPSAGLSRSFSEIVRFNFNKAREYNRYGIRVFLFFMIQLVMRIVISGFLLPGRRRVPGILIATDLFLSVSLFLICFWPFMVFLTRELTR
jgi:hypothetical protein